MFVKICGIRSEDDALLAVACGADALGFVFAASPRQVSPRDVVHIVHRLPREVLTVGVFRDERPARVVEVVQECGLRAAQLHGSETPEQTAFVRGRVGRVIKAFPAGSPEVADAARWNADLLLLDSPTPGSGAVFDWSMAGEAPLGRKLLLAGGLTPENVGAAIRAVRPFGVDVSSGVEAAPGRKDPRKLRAFVAAARAAGSPIEATADAASGRRAYDWWEEGS